MARRVLLALAALAAVAALLPTARGDATAYGMHYAELGSRGAACGGLGQACCEGEVCKGKGMACAPAEAQVTRCVACGDEGLPACAGGKCDDGLVAIEGVGPLPVCVGGQRTKPGPPLPTSGGAPGKERDKRVSDAGRVMSGACSADEDCKARSACMSGVCTPCGAVGQACCPRGQPCKDYGGKVGCFENDVLKAAMCVEKAD